MNKTNNTPNNMKKEKRGLRKKLYAALCMLLVCTTLLTTATYAWLSLSVAPAVEKVKTTITGNGSLEIALATTDVIKNLDLIDDFESLTGFDADGNYDSKANANWGNLVDLSDDKYGLSLLKLYPALLNIVGGKVGDNPLKVANFGADGRVTFLNADTTSAMYDTNTGAFLLNGSGDYGVRALGVSTSTGLWDALESALRDTKKDADNLLKEKVSVTLSGISTDASIAQYIEFMSLADANGKPTVKSLINVAEKILGTDPVEATETTEAVPGTDGLMDKLDTAVRNLVLASSGYSDKYVSISADEMLEKVESDMSTLELIENYVIDGTDLANLCDHYLTAANRAEQLQAYYEILLTKASNETGTQEDLEIFGAPIFGDSFNTSFSAWINRTVTMEKTVETVVNGQTVEKTVTETVVTHEGEIISAPTLAELDAMITALEQPAAGEKEVVSCTASNKTKNIDVLDTDNLLSAVAQIAGTFGSSSTSIDALENNFLGKPLMVVVPCNIEKCAIDQLSSVEKEFAYQESLYTLQTMWNELDIHRNALAAAIDGEMTALGDIVDKAIYFEQHNADAKYWEETMPKDGSFGNYPITWDNYDYDGDYIEVIEEIENYTAPESASHDKLQAHVSTMQSALDFYYDFTVQAALTYASKDTTPVDAYINLTKLLATEEGVRTIPLADILDTLGTGIASQYAPALSSYNGAVTAVANAQQLIDDYNTMVDEQTKAAQANGTTPPPHPTWQEDLTLRSAFSDTLIDYVNNQDVGIVGGYYTYSEGGLAWSFVDLGIGQYIYTVFGNYYNYPDNNDIIRGDLSGFSGEMPALFSAWLELTDYAFAEDTYRYEAYEAAIRITEFIEDYYFGYGEKDLSPIYKIFDILYDHNSYEYFDSDELFSMGYEPKESYDQYDVNSMREAYNTLSTKYLPMIHNFIKGTVKEYLLETGLVNDDGITITDAQGNVAMTTSVKTILKGIIDTVFADSTKPMADRIEAELKTAIGNIPYAEFRMYADELTYALSTDHLVWAYIMEAVSDYDNILSQLTTLDNELKRLEADGTHELTWNDIASAVKLITGESTGMARYSGNDYEALYLPDNSLLTNLASLYSDKFEYETYNRGGTWRYTPYNLESPLPELELGLAVVTSHSTATYRYSHYGYVSDNRFYFDRDTETETRLIGNDLKYFIRANGSFSPDNGITPLYNLAVNNSKSVQTDRSLMFRNLVKEMKLAKASAEDSKHMINLNTLTEYIGKTMYKGDYEYVDEDFKLMTLNDLGQSMVATKLPETLPETFTYDEVEMLITTLDGVTDAMNSYKASLRTAFMLWASSANGTKAAYKAVAANYTGTLDDMMAQADLSAGNVYYDAYNYVQQILDKTQQSRELLVTIMAGKPETVTENDTVQAATLKQALLPLAGQLYWGVYGSTFNPFDRVALYSDDSVMGYIYALYIPSGSEYYSVQLDNSYYNIRFRAPATNLMQQAINTAVEGGITFDANVSANTYANAILSDSYAFAIDILLRTNAIDSNVLLQTEEMQRIYNEQFGDVETMGKGSYLKYTLTNESQKAQMSAINDCVRVVFTDTNTGEILAVAKPDALKVPDLSYEEIYGDNPKEDESERDEIEYVGYLHLCDYTITDSGILYVGDQLDSAAIMPLERNKTTPVTVYVYLDGNDMTNAMASATEHINFDMNLQFASDAELVPATSNLGGSNNDIPSTPANPTPDTPSGGGTTAPDEPVTYGPVSNIRFEEKYLGLGVVFDYPEGVTDIVDDVCYYVKFINTATGKSVKEYTRTNNIFMISSLPDISTHFFLEEGIYDISVETWHKGKVVATSNAQNMKLNISETDGTDDLMYVNINPLSEEKVELYVSGATPNTPVTVMLGREDTTSTTTSIKAKTTETNKSDDYGNIYDKEVLRREEYINIEDAYIKVIEYTDIRISDDGLDATLNYNLRYDWTKYTEVSSGVIASGICGDNVTWALDSTGTMTISGNGEMEDYMYNTSTPWANNKQLIKKLVVENGVTSIGENAFGDCDLLTNVILSDSVKTIDTGAFALCDTLYDITIPDGLTTIENDAFFYCKTLTNIIIPEGVTFIGHSAFYGCESLTSITIPGGVTNIGINAFRYCSNLTNVTIHEGVISISEHAFDYCNMLRTVAIPSTLTNIDAYAFYYCDISDVYYNGTEQQRNSINIGDYNEPLLNATIHYAM